jgi:hypothetical protein
VRKENWEYLLAEYVRQSQELEFAWGTNNCALWASRWVDTATDSGYAADWEGQYDSAEAAQAFMESRGFANPEAIADEHLATRPSVAYARRGDLVLHPDGALGICNGRASVFLIAHGVTAFPTTRCLKAWEV